MQSLKSKGKRAVTAQNKGSYAIVPIIFVASHFGSFGRVLLFAQLYASVGYIHSVRLRLQALVKNHMLRSRRQRGAFGLYHEASLGFGSFIC